MFANNAFLRLIFPPDLSVINLTAPESTVVGAYHSINVTIRNDGRSDAHDFNVTFYIDRKQMIRIPHLDLAAGENVTLHLYNWTPKMLGRMYNLTAAADVLSGEDWNEVETDNNAMTSMSRLKRVDRKPDRTQRGGWRQQPDRRRVHREDHGQGHAGGERVPLRGWRRGCWHVFAHGVDHEGCCVACADAFCGRRIPDGAEELREGAGGVAAAVFKTFHREVINGGINDGIE